MRFPTKVRIIRKERGARLKGARSFSPQKVQSLTFPRGLKTEKPGMMNEAPTSLSACQKQACLTVN